MRIRSSKSAAPLTTRRLRAGCVSHRMEMRIPQARNEVSASEAIFGESGAPEIVGRADRGNAAFLDEHG